MLEPLTTRKPYLFVAHPGHELCVHGWLEQTQPRVFLLTDGSGRSGRSRVESTTNVLAQTGCQRGPIYGRLTDRQLYEAILDQNVELFRNLTEEFAAALVDEEVTFVSGDAAEGFNPGHDLCRLIINAAVEIAQSRAERKITNTDFLLVDSHEIGRA